MVIFGKSVDAQKTKVMFFRKRGGLLVVNDFNYSGTVFNYTG